MHRGYNCCWNYGLNVPGKFDSIFCNLGSCDHMLDLYRIGSNGTLAVILSTPGQVFQRYIYKIDQCA